MAIRYPNGKIFKSKLSSTPEPMKKRQYANRGMTLEEDLNVTNSYYLQQQIAVIHKKPTPIQVVNVDYPRRSSAVIKEAYFRQASTTDYNGLYKGSYIDFEAKETNNKTSFPLQNFHDHQIKHMESVINHGGICFVILRFSKSEENYLFEAKHLFEFWNAKENGGRKSIPKTSIDQFGHSISTGYSPRIDYLKVIDKLFFE